MGNRGFSEEILDQLEKLEAKYDAMGQDLSSYLDGLLHSDYLTYWDYIHLDTLLSLQSPRTPFPDEKIFILYHQITELYFKLVLHEMDQLIFEDHSQEVFVKRVKRINRYFDQLISSFEIMIEGMDREQFLNFRMSLLPSSGFQSAQYRMIEISATHFQLLTISEKKQSFTSETPLDEVYEHLYWKKGATELATGKKTLTLRQFEDKYHQEFINRAAQVRGRNLNALLLDHHMNHEDVKEELRRFDFKANVSWPLMHFKSAVRYLQRDPEMIKATGGTNWQKYLPPKHQQIIFFPSLHTEAELQNWGVKEHVKAL